MHGPQQVGVHGRRRSGGGTQHGTVGVCQGVVADDQVQIVTGRQLAVGVQARGDQLQGAFDVAGPALAYLQHCLFMAGAEAHDAAVFQFRNAHQEAGAVGVDETGAIEADAVGVGQQVVGALAEDFLRAVDVGRAEPADLEHDGAGGLALELSVCIKHWAQRRLPRLQGVVQHHAGCADVVVAELIVRGAGAVGGDDVQGGYALLLAEHRLAVGAGQRRDALAQAGQAVGQQRGGNRPAQVVEGEARGSLSHVFYLFCR